MRDNELGLSRAQPITEDKKVPGLDIGFPTSIAQVRVGFRGLNCNGDLGPLAES